MVFKHEFSKLQRANVPRRDVTPKMSYVIEDEPVCFLDTYPFRKGTDGDGDKVQPWGK